MKNENDKVSWKDMLNDPKAFSDAPLPELRKGSLPQGYDPEEQSVTIGCCFFSAKKSKPPTESEGKRITWVPIKGAKK